MSSDKFLRGAMILTLAGLMVKVIGSVNRILLSRDRKSTRLNSSHP